VTARQTVAVVNHVEVHDDIPQDSAPPRQLNRQRAIAELVIAKGTLRIEDLVRHFGVSAMTVRRDLDELESHGILRKSRGQATALASSLFESNTTFRLTHNRQAKEALARAALTQIRPGQTVMLDDSTTGVYLARLLPQRAPLTVVTNFFSVANELLREPAISLDILGGRYHSWCDAMLGSITIDDIRRLRVDTVVMSTSAVIDDVTYHHTQETDLLKRAMFDSAASRILYFDHSKFERRALYAHVELKDFDVVIVDSGTSAENLARLHDTGVNVVVAHLPDHGSRQRIDDSEKQ